MQEAERRHTERRELRLNCFVFLGKEMVPAKLHNQSPKGALIEIFGADAYVPDQFEVMVTASEPLRTCSVVRREGQLVGVTWVD